MDNASQGPTGDPEQFRWGIDSIVFSGGEELSVPRDALTILIGPNNSGKSTALRELHGLLVEQPNQGGLRVIWNAKPFREGRMEDCRAWLMSHYPRRPIVDDPRRPNPGVPDVFFTIQGATTFAAVGKAWPHGNRLQELNAFLVHKLDSISRISGHSAERIELHTHTPTAYIHVLQADDTLAARISSEVRGAFGEGLVINWTSTRAQFHVGDEPTRTRDQDRVSTGYARALSTLPILDNAGDGMRSFVGSLLATECGNHPVLIIDEPDSFLAPPQARRLGRLLATSARSRHRQVIVATHSSDLVQGALSQGNVAVCRVTRDGSVNHGHLLDSERLADLTRKPLLRSAAAIDGVFHHGVIACEADSDCRFYQALLDRLESKKEIEGPLDLYFVPAGGKGELATLATAYSNLRVPVAVIADLDLLQKEGELRNVVTGLGKDYSEVQKLAREVRTAFGELPPSIGYDQFEKAITEILEGTKAAKKLDPEHRRRLSEVIRDAADWSEAKKYGLLKLKGGQLASAKDLLERLASWGLFLLPHGVLECWWRAGPAGSKTEWFVAAMKKLDEDKTAFATAEVFAARVAHYFGKRTATLDISRWLDV